MNQRIPIHRNSLEWQSWLLFLRNFHNTSKQTLSLVHKMDSVARPYLKITIYEMNFRGLLDSGSEISIIGGDALKHFTNFATLHKSHDLDFITTANGSPSPVTGYIFLPVTVNGKTNIIKFYIIPGVTTELLLGMNFWKQFNIAPDVLSLLNNSEYIYSYKQVNAVVPTNKFLHDLDSLSEHERRLVEEVIREFEDISAEKRGLGRTHLVTHKIDTGDHPPIKQRYYPMSPEKLAEMNKHLDQMLKDDVVEPSSSPWNNPVTLARKADGTTRFCLDSRKLNAITKHDAYPLPYISQILDRLRNAKYLSSIDLKSAYLQVPLDSLKSRERTAFTIPSRGLFHFKVMCFGLTSAPATQQR